MKNQKEHLAFFRLKIAWLLVLVLGLAGCDQQSAVNEAPAPSKINNNFSAVSRVPPTGRTLTRLFWQDRKDGVVYAGDLSLQGDQYGVVKTAVKNLPELPLERNSLVQMEVAQGRLFVGVRDNSDGQDSSGWIEIETGVEEENHGDHSHWHYSETPEVFSATLDSTQGNPAHVYRYGSCIYIANDRNNGFTQIQPPINSDSKNVPSKMTFFRGGGGHITLAAVADRIAYSTWIDRSGDNAGRVDVVDLRGKAEDPRYSFQLPVGGIHGATACGNRVYFAPANGLYWVSCDFDFSESSDTVNINHLSLDDDPSGKAYRTGAFCSFQDHLLCIANSKSGEPALCVVNATAPKPTVTRINCGGLEGLKLSTVSATTIVGNKPFAFAFAEGDGMEERLLIFELDPNGDRNFADTRLAKTVKVGASKLEGHFGHHGITFLNNQRVAVATNPGDGTLSIIDLQKQEVVQTIEIGGQPTKLTCFGDSM